MGIELSNQFTVTASPDDTYSLLINVERVAPCIPGAQMIGAAQDGAHNAEMTMRVGPMKLAFNGVVKVVEQDDSSRRAVMVANGREQRGQGTAQATMQMRVGQSDGGGSRVTIDTDVQIAGRLAQIGSGVMADVAARMISEMAKCIEATLQPPAAESTSRMSGAAAGGSPMAGDSTVGAEGSGMVRATGLPRERPAVRAKTPNAGSLILHVVIGRLRAFLEMIHRRVKPG